MKGQEEFKLVFSPVIWIMKLYFFLLQKPLKNTNSIQMWLKLKWTASLWNVTPFKKFYFNSCLNASFKIWVISMTNTILKSWFLETCRNKIIRFIFLNSALAGKYSSSRSHKPQQFNRNHARMGDYRARCVQWEDQLPSNSCVRETGKYSKHLHTTDYKKG